MMVILIDDMENTVGFVWFKMLNTTFHNIPAISWWLVLLVEETGVPRENP